MHFLLLGGELQAVVLPLDPPAVHKGPALRGVLAVEHCGGAGHGVRADELLHAGDDVLPGYPRRLLRTAQRGQHVPAAVEERWKTSGAVGAAEREVRRMKKVE